MSQILLQITFSQNAQFVHDRVLIWIRLNKYLNQNKFIHFFVFLIFRF